MEVLIAAGKYKEAFETVVKELATGGDNRELKELFVFVLTTYCEQLQEQENEQEVLNCYATALKFFGQDSAILNELGTFFAKHNRDAEAKELFHQACRNDCYNLQAYMNLQNTKNKMARWHFRMLNDHSRNSAFKKAIQYWIRRRKKLNVLDIGSGTGLLSMYAANVASVQSVHAVECCEIMSKISSKVFSVNPRGKVVRLVTKHSKDLEVGEDIPVKASLIVSETLDCGAFGEGILDTFIHAKENLLAPNGKIVPWKVRIHIAGYRSKTLCANKLLVNDSILEYIFLGNYRMVAKNDEPYDAEYVDKIGDFKFVTNVEMDALEVDFNDLSSMQKHFDGIIKNELELNVTIPSEGFLDGFVTWFTLFLNESDPSNVITTAPKSESCWPQAIFKLRKRVPICKDDVLKIAMSCKDGVLTVHHELDVEPDKIDLEVDPSVLQFLNDDEYLRELEFAVGKHRYPIRNCLDYTPFPFVGLMLLKEAKIHKLYCKKKDEELIKVIAEANMISGSSLEFLEDPIFNLPLEFHMIILHPFHPLGDLDSQIITDYPKYSRMLACRSLMVPQKITVFGELINSDFLVDTSRVTNFDVKRMKIDKYINEYMTEVHLDLDSAVEHEKLSPEFKLSDVHFDSDFHETIVDVPVHNTGLPIQGILFHHKIKLTGCANKFSTNRKSKLSCFRRCAQVLILESNCEVTMVSVSYQQNSGIVRCDVIG